MSNRTVEAVLRLSSKLGSMDAFRRLSTNFDKVNRTAKAFNRTQSAIAASMGRATAATARLLAPAAVAYGTQRAVVEYARLERQLTRIGLKIGANRKDMMDLNAGAIGVAQRYAVANDSVVETIDAYAETGANFKDIKSDLDGLVKAQQAMGAEGRDVVGTWDAARKSFGLLSNQAESFFDMVAAGGNSGKFEGSDLAKYLPSLMPTAAVHGMSGLGGTAEIIGALEAMRDRTGESGTAATSLQDFMDKLNSPDVQRNFKKFNIDLPKALAKARKDGVPLFESMSKLLQKATRGDAAKLGALFGERDSRNFALMLMQDIDGVLARIRQLREESKGTIQINVDAVMKDSQASIDRLSNSYDRMVKSFGAAASSSAVPLMDKVSDYIEYANAVKRGLESEGKSGWDDYGLSDEARAAYAAKGGYKSAADQRREAERQHMADAYSAYRSTGRHRELSFSFGVDSNGTPYPRPYDQTEYSDFGNVGRPELGTVPPDLLTRRDRGRAIGALMNAGADENYQEFTAAAQSGAVPDRAGRSIRAAAEAFNRAIMEERSIFARMLEGVGARTGQEVTAARSVADPDHAGNDLRQAGDDAGRSISAAAEAINRGAEQGASTFARMLEGQARQFGLAAAAAFNSNLKPVSVTSPVGNGAAGQLASGNRGVSMPTAGLPGGGPR